MTKEPRAFVRAARWGAALLVVSFGAAYLLWRPFQPTGPAMTDFAAYYAAGSVWAHGGDPYSRALGAVERALPGGTQAGFSPYVGPPLGLPLWGSLAQLPYGVAVIVWGAFLAACIAVILIVPARLAGRTLSRGDALTLLLFACACGPLILGLSLGQAALPAAASVALAILALSRARPSWAAVAAAIAALLKPNLTLPLIAALRSGRIALAFAAAAGIAVALNALCAGGPRAFITYLQLLPLQTQAERWYSYQFTVVAIAHGFGFSDADALRAGVAVAVAAVALVCIAIVRTRAGVAQGALIACAALPFVVPYVHEPDVAIVLLPALVAFHRARGAAWAAAASAVVVLCVNPFALAHGPSGLAFSLVGATVAALALAALAHDVPAPLRLAPFAVVALVLLLGATAPKPMLPTWPADLPRDFVADAHASAGSVWHREIVATGLEAPAPWIALARLMTLGGCVLGGVALTASLRNDRFAMREPIALRRAAVAVADGSPR